MYYGPNFLNIILKNPNWFDRDRFVLSAGHGSMLLYSLLHLTGYDLPLDELKNFRQLNSLTPGTSGIWTDPGCGNHNRPAWAGVFYRCRDGDS
jgi:transketolase